MSLITELKKLGVNVVENKYTFTAPLKKIPKYKGVILHYFGIGSFTGYDVSKINPGKYIHEIHKNSGYIGLGYNGIVDQYGVYFTGRDYGTQGAHCADATAGIYRNDYYGLHWFGGIKDVPTSAALETISKVIAVVSELENFSCEKKYIGGHRDHLATACPGALYSHIPDMIKRANEILNPAESKVNTNLTGIKNLEAEKLAADKKHWGYKKAMELYKAGIIKGKGLINGEPYFGLSEPVDYGTALAIAQALNK